LGAQALRAVIFDLGGVVMASPLRAIARYERDHGLEHNAINHAIVAAGEQGAWSRLERGELGLPAFFSAFEADCDARGLRVDSRRMMEYIAAASGPHPPMLTALRRIRARGLRTGALTNNWKREEPPPNAGHDDLRALFDVFIESSVVGLRKPDPRIYQLCCRELDVTPAEAAFLDDIGRNLKAARALGMITLKVDDPDRALGELQGILGFPLG
jgi:epoxide hydrolase-like predicted phosphatase